MLDRLKLNPLFYGLTALVIGFIGQILLASGHILIAAGLYAIALFLIILAFRNLPGPTVNLSANKETSYLKWPRWRYITAGCSVAFSALAFYLFTTSFPSIIPWLLHLCSIAFLIVSAIRVEGIKEKSEEINPSSPWSWIEIGLFLAIFGVAVFMRVYRLDQVPFGTWYDEADIGLNALKILNTPGFLPVFADSTRLPAHFVYLIALSFQIFGTSTLAIRVVSFGFGLATVAAAYFVGRELFNRRIGLVLAFLLAVSRWDINWSRIGMHGISVPFFELLTMGFILRALRRQRLLDYAIAGITLGFGLCFYFSIRFFPIIIVLFLLVLWLSRHDLVKSSWQGFLIFIIGAFIAVMPVIQFAVMQPDTFWSRMRDISIFNGKTSQEAVNSIVNTTVDHLLMFNYMGDRNGRHNLSGEPMLDPISGCLMVLGLALSVWRIRRPGSFLLLAWLLLMLVPAIFSLDFEAPQSYRAIGSLPAAYLLAVVPIHALWQEWDKLSSVPVALFSRRRTIIFGLPLILILGILGYYNYHIYFDLQANSFESWDAFSTPETIVGNVMRSLGNQVDYYVSAFYYQVPTVNFLAPGVTTYHRLETNDTLPLPLDSKKGVVLLVDPERSPFIQQAKIYYPNATFQEFKAPGGQTALYEIYLKPADIAANQGLVASYYLNAKWSEKPVVVRNETNFNFNWKDGDPAPYPFGVEWKGVLFAPVYGTYQLVARSPSPTTIFVDEVQVALKGASEQTAKIELAKGNHTIRIQAIAQNGHFELLWQAPSGKLTSIPLSSLLLPPITNNGLVGSYYPNGNWQNPPAYVEIDPWIYFYFHNPPLTRPYTVEWVGKIKISNAGQYHFGLESIDESSLYIDDKQIINDESPSQYVEKVVDLPIGFHLIRLRFADRTGYTHIDLYWTPPGGEQEAIPSDVLFPLQAGEKVINTVNLVNETPVQPIGPSSDSPNQTDLASINAQLLWKTGSCGSSQGQLQSPHGIAVDKNGNIWVADTGNHRVAGISAQGKFFKMFGKFGEGQGQFLQPYDLVVGPDGSLDVLDSGNQNFLQRFNQSGTFLTSFGANLDVYRPRGLGIDSTGNLYIADTGRTRLIKVSPSGVLLEQWKNETGKLGFGQLVSVAIASDGSIYIIDPGGSIWKLDPDGKYTNWPAVVLSDTATGAHIGLNPNNIIFITDPEKQRVLSFSNDGKLIGQLSISGENQGLFSKPIGLAMGPDNTLFISDTITCRILAFRLTKP
jgi:4-amino-4-deoxy-L-arabinose transferase-like glycosyltransferase/streptogramin lyase